MSKSFANVRLSRELSKLQSESDKLDGIIIENPTDLMVWNAKISGPPGTPFEKGIFDIILRFDTDYPVKPPSVKFLTPMFHPNIYRDGKICVDILQSSEWTPAQNIRTILVSIMSLLMDPNPASPANREAAELYNKDQNAYGVKVREFIEANKGKSLV
jgi:ubiquitin-conjugating enzyme E2 A